jgi:hypothetical protein
MVVSAGCESQRWLSGCDGHDGHPGQEGHKRNPIEPQVTKATRRGHMLCKYVTREVSIDHKVNCTRQGKGEGSSIPSQAQAHWTLPQTLARERQPCAGEWIGVSPPLGLYH